MENILEKIRASFSTVPSFQTPPDDELKNIRLLLYRDCERRGRKCLYDSKYVLKEGDKFMYKIPPGSSKEIRDLSEYIFGCVPLSDKVGTKRFCKIVDDDHGTKFVWSQVFCSNGRNRWKATPVENTSGSSGYCTTSDDSSAELKKQQWSLPTILSYWSNQSPVIQSSHSLPGSFSYEVRTLLGLAVVIEEDTESPKNWPQHSKLIEKSTDTFKEAALTAYNDPENFVRILHNFTHTFKCELLSSVLHPQTINLKTLHIPNYRSLPCAKTLNKFICSYVKSNANVILQTRRIDNYLKTVLYILKLVNTKDEVGFDASNYDSGIYSVSEASEVYYPSYNSSSSCHSHTNSSTNSVDEEIQIESAVSFHLGDNSEDEQTFSRLTLGDVDMSKLNSHNNKSGGGGGGGGGMSLSKPIPIQMENVLCSIEKLDKYINIEVQFDEKTLKFPTDKLFFVNYSNNVNRLYEMQWMHSSIDIELTLNSTNTKSKYIVYNLDKNCIKYVNVIERDCNNVFEMVEYLVREKCSNEKITEYLLLHLDTI